IFGVDQRHLIADARLAAFTHQWETVEIESSRTLDFAAPCPSSLLIAIRGEVEILPRLPLHRRRHEREEFIGVALDLLGTGREFLQRRHPARLFPEIDCQRSLP